jgi:hypothetical protein
VTLPYSPEFEPSSNQDGRALLSALAQLTGGAERISMTGLFAATAQSAAAVPLAPVLVAVALLLLLAEVVLRRFFAGRRRESHPKPALAPIPSKMVVRTGAPQPVPVALSPSTPVVEPKSGVRSALEVAQERARKRLKR